MNANRMVSLSDVASLRKLGGFEPSYLHAEPPKDIQLS